jgi:hypothetical protein
LACDAPAWGILKAINSFLLIPSFPFLTLWEGKDCQNARKGRRRNVKDEEGVVGGRRRTVKA